MKFGLLFCGVLAVMIGTYYCDDVADSDPDTQSNVSDKQQTEVTISIARKLKNTLENWRDECGQDRQKSYDRIDFVIKILMKVINKHEEYKASGERANFGDFFNELQPYFKDVCNNLDNILSDNSIPFWEKYHDQAFSLFKPIKSYYSHFSHIPSIGKIFDDDTTSSLGTSSQQSNVDTTDDVDDYDAYPAKQPSKYTTKYQSDHDYSGDSGSYYNKPTYYPRSKPNYQQSRDNVYYQQPSFKPYYQQSRDNTYYQQPYNQQSRDDGYYQPSRQYNRPSYNRGYYRPSNRWANDDRILYGYGY